MKEYRFEIYSDSKIIGYSDLEKGDAPMGVAFALFHPSEGYSGLESEIEKSVAQNDFTELALSVKEIATGHTIENAFITINPPPKELASEPIEITVGGIPYPQYGVVFPQHVESDKKRFE